VNLRESMLAAADDAPLTTSTVDIDQIIVRERRAGAARRAGVAGLALATVVGAALAAPPLFGGREPPRAGGAAPPVGAAEAPVLDAVGLLRLASQHVAAASVVAARTDQYVLVEMVDTPLRAHRQGKTSTGENVVRIEAEEPMISNEWRSVDGTHDGLARSRPYASPDAKWVTAPLPGCRNGRWVPAPDRPDYTEACTPQPALLPGLPTDPDAMLRYLYRAPTEDYEAELSADQRAFGRISTVINGSLNSPAVLTAVYRAAERIPGVTVARDAVDVTGRHGVALVRTADHIRTELIFDPTTYAYLGANMVVVDAYSVHGKNWVINIQPDDVFERSAILRVTVVDRAGQLP
jgi:hypothetical protein